MDFYINLTPFSSFRDATIRTNYSHVPESWSVIVTDIVNSSAAISNGRYKEVNTTGALAIVALANQNMHRHTPFVFGGDGITMLCPPEYLEKIKDIQCPILSFYGGQDAPLMESLPALKEEMSKQGKQFEVITYPDARHAFFNDTNPATYNEAAAKDSWQKTLTFLAKNLRVFEE